MAQPKESTSETHCASHLLIGSPPQQKGSWSQTQVLMSATEQPSVACAVQQSPTFPPPGPQIPLEHVPLQHWAFVEQA